jgi:V8-like Glu-specific endopeptidase
MRKSVGLSWLAISCLVTTSAVAQQYTTTGNTLTYEPPPSLSPLDYQNARPMPLPQLRTAPSTQSNNLIPLNQTYGPPGVSAGGMGTGKQSTAVLVPAVPEQTQPPSATPEEYGTSNQVFTTSRANAFNNPTVYNYPFRAAGKLFFTINGAGFLCSASLIKPGLAVTAAHCVANYGQNQFYSNWQYVPAYNNGVAPYGVWNVKNVTILTAYFNGTDNCTVFGVVCPDDVAILNIATPNGLPGITTGWLGFGWNGYSYNPSNQVQITQLGYPVALDGGNFMERTDSQGFVDGNNSNNTIIGSLQTGGSSGGPWVVNLGTAPILNGTSFGTGASHNIVVGVTSWGYTDTTIKQQGAAPFTSGNILNLVNIVCAANPGKC